ncbi:hypothetical protein CEP54_014712 [Fusarium duplospermum]|uniref:Uncharacterized protein n=1 Tax=Fusarium duplospermum TaxID=1325734 RepID=A0A428NU63_9HYPO|nr:hypothetical protein CEP54_014712 [Fusarium duplospermum]
MPPKTTRAKNKRPLEEGDDNARQSRSKTAKTTETSGEQPSNDNGEGAQTQQPSRVRRIARGPKGEIFLPEIMPQECAKVIKDIPIPGGWVRGIDATPDRSMTLNSREWWEEFGPWLEPHKKKLKLSAADWKKKDAALKKDPELVPEDEGNDDWDFICCFKPNLESRQDEYEGDEEDGEDDEDDGEDEEDEEDEEEEDGGEGNGNGKGKEKEKGKKQPEKKPIDKLASLHPEWPWVFTVLGRDRLRWWIQEATKRDQDSFGLHYYNDFTWYGALEVVENAISAFDAAFKPKASYRDWWPEVEGLILGLYSTFLEFEPCDDGQRCGKLIELIGYMAVAAMEALKKDGVFKPDSGIRNLGLVLAMFIQYGYGELPYGFEEEICSWAYKLLDMADEAGIDLTGPPRYEKAIKKIMDERDRKAKSMKKWDNVNWATKLRGYTSKHGGKTHFGGHEYDITKQSPAERKRHSLDAGGGWDLM